MPEVAEESNSGFDIQLTRACCRLPVHGDLVVALRGKRNPVDVASVVGGVNLPQEQHAALLLTKRFR